MNKLIILLMSACFIAVGCQPADKSPEFTEIKIESHPKGSWYAHKTVKPSGYIIGGHMSGDPTPFIHESEGQVSPQDMSELRELVSGINSSTNSDTSSQPDQRVESYRSVIVIFDDGTSATAYAKFDKPFKVDAFEAIWKTLIKYKAGAW